MGSLFRYRAISGDRLRIRDKRQETRRDKLGLMAADAGSQESVFSMFMFDALACPNFIYFFFYLFTGLTGFPCSTLVLCSIVLHLFYTV